MISLSAAATSALGRSWTYHLRVQSVLGSEVLASDIPVTSGNEVVDRTMRIPERVTLRVPRRDRGVSWDPVGQDHPLACWGQRLHVDVGIGLAGGRIEWIRRGEYVITDSKPQGDDVSVTALGLLQLVDEARLVSPFQPSGTLVSSLRGLVEPALTIVVDAGLTDRAVPAGANYDEDRLGAVLELLDAWPADARVVPAGYLSVVPATDPTVSVLSLTDDVGGTTFRPRGGCTRDQACTVAVVRGAASDGGQVQGVAYDRSGGPLDVGGPFNALPVPTFLSSPLLTTVGECTAAAETLLARMRRSAARRLTIDMVPHLGLEVGDALSVTGADLVGQLCIVETLSLPLTPDGGAETITVRVVE